ncbi:hypothetical protein [Streptomyces roseifaciens]|uniref:hypothetical protein n=1 Tax=Streptomyces roseifaciens TaxID=1488406 RepID=UPI000717F07A|nr:hypothetical protein [Streptomyces roseifaciens]
MGWTVLYIAFGVVALWLLGEVLLQYKARLRWRLLAFAGFLGVVAGVVIPSVAVIAAGAVAFAVGQTYVTLSFRRGFSRGWALRRDKAGNTDNADNTGEFGKSGKEEKSGTGGRSGRGVKSGRRAGKPAAEDDAPKEPRAGRRRRTERAEAPPLDETAAMPAVPPLAEPASDPGPPVAGHQPHAVPAPGTAGDAAYGGYGDGGYGAASAPPAPDHGPVPYDDPYGAQVPSAPGVPAEPGQFDYGQGQYAAYSDPYIGSRQQAYEPYDSYGQYQQPAPQPYGMGGHPAEAYAPAPQYDTDTPPGGVWVPQQRDGDYPPVPQGYAQQPYPGYPQQLPAQGQGQGPGYGEQYTEHHNEQPRY